jgi:hypothetical protein
MGENVFPNITPNSIKESVFHPFEHDDIKTEEDFQDLVMLMFHYPERDYYLYQEKDGAQNQLLITKVHFGDLVFEKTEFFYYRRPNGYGYVHLGRSGGESQSDWAREVVKKGPMYLQTTLKLSERKKRELEIWQKIEMEEHYRRKRDEVENAKDVFISYASANNKEAEMIYDAVLKAGGKAFLASKNLNWGKDFAERIRTVLTASRELWLLVSPTSLRSDWVLSEWGAAWALRKTIIPILHQCSVNDLPDRLQRLQCIDFYRYQELIDQKIKVEK